MNDYTNMRLKPIMNVPIKSAEVKKLEKNLRAEGGNRIHDVTLRK